MVSQMLTSDHRPLGCVVGVAALLVAGSSTGLLQPERYGTTLAHPMALLALTGYLVIVISESVTRWSFAVMILSRAYHWETGVMLMWSTLLNRADLEKVAAGTACLLVVLNHYMRALAGTVAHFATSTEEMR